MATGQPVSTDLRCLFSERRRAAGAESRMGPDSGSSPESFWLHDLCNLDLSGKEILPIRWQRSTTKSIVSSMSPGTMISTERLHGKAISATLRNF